MSVEAIPLLRPASRTPRLGLSLGWSPREPIDRLVSLLRAAEETGVATGWLIDSQLAMRDAYLALAVLARETDRLQLGTGVTNVVTRDATVVANAHTTLAALAPGRALVGIGAGDSAVFPLGMRPSGVRQLESGVLRIRDLLHGREVDTPAGVVQLAEPVTPPPPVFLAASQPRMLALAGRVADGVIIMGPSDPETVATQLAHVDAGAREAGRDPTTVLRDLWVTMAVGGQEAVDAVKSWGSAQARWLTTWREVPASLERFRAEMEQAHATYDFGKHLSLSADHAGGISDDFARVLAVAGTIDECQQRLRELTALGIDQVTVPLLSGGRERRLKELAEVWAGVIDRADESVQTRRYEGA